MCKSTHLVCACLQLYKINPAVNCDSDKTLKQQLMTHTKKKRESMQTQKMSSFGVLIILFAPFGFAVKQHSSQPCKNFSM